MRKSAKPRNESEQRDPPSLELATATPLSPDAPTPTPPPDPEGAAERVLGGGTDAPRPGSSTERVRRYRERKRAERGEKPTLEVTNADVQETAAAAEVVWDLVLVPFAGGRLLPLHGDQAERLGRACAPLVKKYLPLIADWQHEVTALLCVVAIVRANYVPLPKSPDDPIPKRTDTPRAESGGVPVDGGGRNEN